ncbi:MAG: glycosyltransferase family 4 protein [Pseudomonadota bacterium]|jgi:glycosyltransferase involved in cell wall biosynthesis|uniref:D-inositol 3-phosphate glycosyltransferase n=1 Tax=anaerobic digester metagenome TaxID=1263854 RepID=A0A485M3K2_9ZZZZ|nr:glycosyltransferase family 4 protein [Pseudomonadota bacterium]HPD20819.1 glycosyltransferase family 4 protein [Deltaproteobacteria bacterium]HPX18364.1 glycosyltransferase family 4 protein [Deltaproteobacteria bacterium]HRS55706.1 glycosyltransferase family 4 protein [Desulfomonilia bacterium]HRV35429.1 glycosyltransferase family 4 protein [Desulfomonilia bacterium]
MAGSNQGREHANAPSASTGSEAPLRICLFTYRGNPTCGGQGVYTKRLSRALADLGHKVDVVSGPPYPVLDSDITLHKLPSLDLYNPDDLFRVPSLKELTSPVNLIEWLGVSSGGFPEPFTSGIRVWNFMRKNARNYDVFHDNQCLAYGLLGIQAIGVPTVATIHHPITVDRDVEVSSEKIWWRKLKVRRWYSFINMQKRVSRRLSHIITVSEASKDDISRQFAIPPYKFRVVANGINTDIFHPVEGIKREENQIMVTNSADTPLKGLRYLIEAVASIRRYRDVKLTVIGKPKKDGVIDRLVNSLGAHDYITFTGRIPDEDFASYYARTTIAVVPSLYEGFGLPAGEAMACRVPVISTTGGALPEVVGDAGVLVKPGDARALEKAIVDLLDNPEKRDVLARAGYERVKRHFTWSNTAQDVVNVYREAIGAHS